MQSEITKRFINLLNSVHYSEAFILMFISLVQAAQSVTTYQQLHEILKSNTNEVIHFFKENPKNQKLIEGKNALCLEAINEYITRVIKSVSKLHGSDIQKFKQSLIKKLKQAIEIIRASTQKVANNSEQLFAKRSNRRILTYSYSKSVVQALKKASKIYEKSLMVYACQSGPLSEGTRTFTQLTAEGINCQLIHDNQISSYIHQVGCVMTGAQVVLQNGSIINRSGTYLLALCAYEASKPFYVFSESYKFVDKVFLSQKDIPQSIQQISQGGNTLHVIPADFTPSKYITLFCSDIGIIPSEGVTVEMNKRYR